MKKYSIDRDFLFNVLFFVNGFLVFWYFSNSVIGNKSLATGLLLLLSIISVVPVLKGVSVSWHSQKWWVISLSIFAGFNIIHLLIEGVEISDDYEKPAKALAVVLVFLYLLHFGFSHRVVGVAIAIATLVGGGYAIYEKFVLDLPRAGTMTNPIRYGYLVTALSLLCFFHARYSIKRWQITFFAVVGGVGLFGAYCTGTRGVALIVLFVLAFFAALLLFKGGCSWMKIGASVGLVLGIFVFLSFNTNALSNYIDRTGSELKEIRKGNLNTSIGLRLQMWHVAFYLGTEYPFFGAGHDYDVIRDKAGSFIEEHGYNPVILTRFGHFHNQYLDSFAKQGVPGLAVWLLFLAGALLGMKTRYRYAVFLIVATLAIGGLTEAVLRSSRLYYLATLGISIFRCLDYFEYRQGIKQESSRPE